jgi:hypothetical protein
MRKRFSSDWWEAQEGYKSSLVQAKDQINSINQEG